jgi:hypothetical protein
MSFAELYLNLQRLTEAQRQRVEKLVADLLAEQPTLTHSPRTPGLAKGKITLHENFDDPLEDCK